VGHKEGAACELQGLRRAGKSEKLHSVEKIVGANVRV
jgi:hypothetical protein